VASGLRILAPDLRGHGRTTLTADPGDWSGWRGFAADLLALLDAAAVERPVVLAGHSLGATTSLLAAAQAPDRTAALVLVEPVLLNFAGVDAAAFEEAAIVQAARRRRAVFPDRAAAAAVYRGRGAFAGWSEAALADYLQDGFHETGDGQVRLACSPDWEALTYARHDYDALDALARARSPVQLLAAAKGSTVGAPALAAAARLGFAVETTPAATHMLPFERPDLVRHALTEAAALRS
jgi:pimeloyl-ACP methyl ester carboxylesterase